MDAATLARALGAVRSGRQWKCKCVCHEDRDPSMIIFDGREAVQVRCLAGCKTADVIEALKARGLWQGARRGEQKRANAHIGASLEERAKHFMFLARRVFDRSVGCAGTIAEEYFAGREIWSVARMIDDIRFSPACPMGENTFAAVVVPLRHIGSGQLRAIQRIFIGRGAWGQIRKTQQPMMLGPASGCAMQLQAVDERGELHIAEGLESALSVIAMDRGPVWAMGSTSLIRSMPVMDDVRRLVIWADNDAPGIAAARFCSERWVAAGRDVKIRRPATDGDDANDVWRQRLGRQ